jgi:hypothetical protein
LGKIERNLQRFVLMAFTFRKGRKLIVTRSEEQVKGGVLLEDPPGFGVECSRRRDIVPSEFEVTVREA